jgi:hypothetical protein
MRIMLHEWQDHDKQLAQAKDLGHFCEVADRVLKRWRSAPKDCPPALKESMFKAMQAHSESRRRKWMQDHPDTEIEPMPDDPIKMSAWLFNVEQTIYPGRIREQPKPMKTPSRQSDMLKDLRDIDANQKRDGIPGNTNKLKRVKEYLKRNKRPDIAETFYLEDGRIKTTMAYRSLFIEK